jgi:hypothetical protein
MAARGGGRRATGERRLLHGGRRRWGRFRAFMKKSGQTSKRRRCLEGGLSIVLVPITVPLLCILATISIPYCFVAVIVQAIQERRFRGQMRGNHRFIEWNTLEPRLHAGEGSLLIEQGQKCPVRFWWTSEKVLQMAPVPPPKQEELDIFGCKEPHSFVLWSNHRYIDSEKGIALLTKPPFALPRGLFFAEFVKRRFPELAVIDTVYLRRRD